MLATLGKFLFGRERKRKPHLRILVTDIETGGVLMSATADQLLLMAQLDGGISSVTLRSSKITFLVVNHE